MSIAIFIQARMGSTRLPGKVLMPLDGKPVLGHVLARVLASGVGEPIVLTTISPKDLPIVKYCTELGVRVFCGSENDVLDRFWQAAKLLDVQNIVRITADCPILDPQVLARVVQEHLESGADYTSNVQVESYPDGLDVEVFQKSALQKAWTEAELISDREHVTPYIRKNHQLFRQHSVENADNLSSLRWTLDNEEDYSFLSAVYGKLGSQKVFGMAQVLEFLEQNPQVSAINSGIKRNEGYAKSLREEQQGA